MSGYLLDTNTVRVWFGATHPHHENVDAAIKGLPETPPLYVSAITRGEIYFGHAFDGDNEFRQRYRAWVDDQFPNELTVGNLSALIYGKIRAEVCRRHAPPGKWTKKKRAEQLYDPVAAREIGIDENDLWLASQALGAKSRPRHHGQDETHSGCDHKAPR
jgi:predicted nucleic acid-binding protein